jgi:CheY-like chemotaxis protein
MNSAHADPISRCAALIVDDDLLWLRMLSDLLRSRGFEVTDVQSAQEGLRTLSEPRRFDLIVSDLLMPEIDGEAFVKAVRAQRSVAPPPFIVAVTGDVTSGLELELQTAGADAVLSKRLGAPLIAATAQMLVSSFAPGACLGNSDTAA